MGQAITTKPQFSSGEYSCGKFSIHAANSKAVPHAVYVIPPELYSFSHESYSPSPEATEGTQDDAFKHHEAVWGSAPNPKQTSGEQRDCLRSSYGDNLSEVLVGWSCVKGAKSGHAETPNQDTFFLLNFPESVVFGVFDGHGQFGHDVSDFISNHMRRLICERRSLWLPLTQVEQIDDQWHVKVRELLVFCFDSAQAALLASATVDAGVSGCTATLCFHAKKLGIILSAHVGDSRAAFTLLNVSEKGTLQLKYPTALTADHNPTEPAERIRLGSQGGHLTPCGRRLLQRADVKFLRSGFSVSRQSPTKQPQVVPPGAVGNDDCPTQPVSVAMGTLAVSRALGDVVMLTSGISHRPDVSFVETPPGTLLVIASDGVWQVFDDSVNVLQMISNSFQKGGGDAQEAANYIVASAWSAWRKESTARGPANTYIDDITAIVAILDDEKLSFRNRLETAWSGESGRMEDDSSTSKQSKHKVETKKNEYDIDIASSKLDDGNLNSPGQHRNKTETIITRESLK